MNKRLFFLLLFVTTWLGVRATPSIPSKVDKILSFLDSQTAKVKEHHKQLTERNLQLRSSGHLRFLPTNITSIRNIRARRRNTSKLRRFMGGLAGGRVDNRFITNQILRVRNLLFNRFRVRSRAPGQMRCSLNIRVEGMQNFFRIGVVLIRLTFRSSCRDSTFTKFVWVNSFDSASHFQLRIGNRRWVMLFGNVDNRNSPYQQMVHYDGYKMLSLFRAARFAGRGGRSSRRRRGVGSSGIKRSSRGGSKPSVRKPRRSRRLTARPAVRKQKRPRVLAELTDKDKLLVPKNTGDTEAERQLRRRRRRKGRRRGGRRRRGRRRRRRGARRSRRRRQKPVRRRQKPRRRRPSQRVQSPSRPAISGPPRIDIPDSPRPSAGPNRSFSSLLNRNDESGAVISPRINEPINILPRIQWRQINTRWEILSSGNPRQPFWQLRHIRRIWRSQNPQIAPARPIRSLKDSLITMSL